MASILAADVLDEERDTDYSGRLQQLSLQQQLFPEIQAPGDTDKVSSFTEQPSGCCWWRRTLISWRQELVMAGVKREIRVDTISELRGDFIV